MELASVELVSVVGTCVHVGAFCVQVLKTAGVSGVSDQLSGVWNR